jgi:hypothetical protein
MTMTKTCPSCGKTFECTHDKNCWCVKISIDESTREVLKKRYSDCLCADCLAQIALSGKINLAK